MDETLKKQSYLDPLVLARLSSMLLRARVVVEGFVAGQHQSPFKGFSLDFVQHREYSPGDEIRYLDWKAYARKDRFYIKQYEEETNLKAYLLVDASASMSYSYGEISKLQYASYLASSLAYLMLKQQDSVGLVSFSDNINGYVPPRMGMGHLSVVLERLEHISGSGQTDIEGVLSKLSQYTKRRGLIIFISDLFDEPEKVLKTLKYFRFKKHEVIVFHILDTAELRLPYDNVVRFEGMEDNEQIVTEPGVIRKAYSKIVEDFTEKYRLGCQENGIDYCFMDTSKPLDYALGAYLTKREMLVK